MFFENAKARIGLSAHGHTDFVHYFFGGSVGLHNVFAGVFFDGVDDIFGIRHVSEEYDNGAPAPIIFTDFLNHFVAAHAGEHNVHENGVGSMLERKRDTFSADTGSEYRYASKFKRIGVEFAEALIILNDKYSGLTHIPLS